MKRKAAIALLSIITVIALCGCGSKSAANTVAPWSTSDEQTNAIVEILSVGGYTAFAEFDVDETYQSAKMGIEYYKDGKLLKDEEELTFPIDRKSQGIAAFSCKYGNTTIGLSMDGGTGSTSDIQLMDYPTEEDESILFTPMTESKDIADGQKIYFGAISAGNNEIDPSVFDASSDKKGLTGKYWLFYVVFSTESLE